jgi:hypothetical protein
MTGMIELLQGGNDLGLGLPAPQRVLALQGGDRLDGVGAPDRLWAGLGQAEVLHLPRPDALSFERGSEQS